MTASRFRFPNVPTARGNGNWELHQEACSRGHQGACARSCAQRPRASGRRSRPHLHAVDAQCLVLNARGHRGGDHLLASCESERRLRCSTPEGIGAAITGQARGRRAPSARAQRPRASGRRSPVELREDVRAGLVLNARGHRGGDHRRASGSTIRSRSSAQRPRASGRRSPRPAGDVRDCLLVLNARGHRGGDHFAPKVSTAHCFTGAQRPRASGRRSHPEIRDRAQRSLCSTPEGIGAAITWSVAAVPAAPCMCSTPEGIGAAITHIGLDALCDSLRCSTPEGIGAAITSRTPRARGRPSFVLNARGHRGGDHDERRLLLRRRPAVLNARGHRGGDHSSARGCSGRRLWCAQRPRASGRRSLRRERFGRLPDEVLNARGHRGGDHLVRRTGPENDSRCAQRPRASGRRSPGRQARLRRRAPVLNARGHRGGDHHKLHVRQTSRVRCSTPEGIGAAITFGWVAEQERARLCSTPEGIGAAITGPAAQPGRAQPDVLNARGHRGGDHRSPSSTPR